MREYSLPAFNIDVALWTGQLTGTMDTWDFAVPSDPVDHWVRGELYSLPRWASVITHANPDSFTLPAWLSLGHELRVPIDTVSVEPGVLHPATEPHRMIYTGDPGDGHFRFWIVLGESIRHQGFANAYKAWHLMAYFSTTVDPGLAPP